MSINELESMVRIDCWPDRDKRVDSLALSERVTDLPGAPQVEVRLKKKFET